MEEVYLNIEKILVQCSMQQLCSICFTDKHYVFFEVNIIDGMVLFDTLFTDDFVTYVNKVLDKTEIGYDCLYRIDADFIELCKDVIKYGDIS